MRKAYIRRSECRKRGHKLVYAGPCIQQPSKYAVVNNHGLSKAWKSSALMSKATHFGESLWVQGTTTPNLNTQLQHPTGTPNLDTQLRCTGTAALAVAAAVKGLTATMYTFLREIWRMLRASAMASAPPVRSKSTSCVPRFTCIECTELTNTFGLTTELTGMHDAALDSRLTRCWHRLLSLWVAVCLAHLCKLSTGPLA